MIDVQGTAGEARQGLMLKIESPSFPAAQLAILLSALDGSYARFAGRGRRGQRPALQVAAIRYGSLEIILAAIEGAGNMMAAKDYLAPWATHLADLLHLKASIGKPLSRPDQKLVQAIAQPVADGSATQINIVHNGDIVVNIGTFEARDLLARDAAGTVDGVEAPVPRLPRVLSRDQVDQLSRGDLVGTAFEVDHTWYARLEGLRRVLVPIESSPEVLADLFHGTPYSFAGRVIPGPRGETVGISLSGAKPLSR